MQTKIEKIEFCNEEVEVFDIQLAKGNNFVAEGVLVHNCELCSSLDGKVIDANDPEYLLYQPSLHPHCRCYWQSITSDSPNIPDVNWVEPDRGLISRFAPFLLLLPDKSKKKVDSILEIAPFAPEAPELFFDVNDVLDIEKYLKEQQLRISEEQGVEYNGQ